MERVQSGNHSHVVPSSTQKNNSGNADVSNAKSRGDIYLSRAETAMESVDLVLNHGPIDCAKRNYKEAAECYERAKCLPGQIKASHGYLALITNKNETQKIQFELGLLHFCSAGHRLTLSPDKCKDAEEGEDLLTRAMAGPDKATAADAAYNLALVHLSSLSVHSPWDILSPTYDNCAERDKCYHIAASLGHEGAMVTLMDSIKGKLELGSTDALSSLKEIAGGEGKFAGLAAYELYIYYCNNRHKKESQYFGLHSIDGDQAAQKYLRIASDCGNEDALSVEFTDISKRLSTNPELSADDLGRLKVIAHSNSKIGSDAAFAISEHYERYLARPEAKWEFEIIYADKERKKYLYLAANRWNAKAILKIEKNTIHPTNRAQLPERIHSEPMLSATNAVDFLNAL